jgi:hypothetical protein
MAALRNLVVSRRFRSTFCLHDHSDASAFNKIKGEQKSRVTDTYRPDDGGNKHIRNSDKRVNGSLTQKTAIFIFVTART